MNHESNEVPTEPTLERRTRRQFTSAEKQRLLAEYDDLARCSLGSKEMQENVSFEPKTRKSQSDSGVEEPFAREPVNHTSLILGSAWVS